MAAKCMNRSRAGKNFSAMLNAARNKILLTGLHRNSLLIDDQGIATLHNEHVFVVIVYMRSRCRRLTAGPKRHLAFIGAVEDIPLNAWSRLT